MSPKFQLVVPKDAREDMHLQPGEKMEVFWFDDIIEFVRVRPIEEMRGFLKGYDPTFEREKEDRI